jgi:RHS repeat-associated protein
MTVMTGYLYDAGGTRVAKGRISTWSCDPGANGFQTTNDYILGPSGEQVTEMGMGGTSNGATTSGLAWQHTNAWAAGSLMATLDNDGWHLYLNDPLGTRRAQTNYEGVLEQTCSSLPYGDGLVCTGSTTYPTEHHFTGKERDTESGNDYFGARYYSSAMGRFMSPDWSAKREPVPYAKLDNPQTLNLYAYVGNNPLIRIDKDGHYYCKGSDPQCAKIADGIKQANAALASGKLSKVESGRLKGALDFLGKSTDMNGVIIKFDSKLQNSELADTHVTTQDIGGGKSMQITTITFNSKALNSNSDVGVGETAVHEATHGIDGKNRGGRDPLFKSEELQTERNAYRNQNYVHEGLGLPSPYGPGGDDVEAGAQRSTAEFCRTGGAC